jgi:hypothetical protein
VAPKACLSAASASGEACPESRPAMTLTGSPGIMRGMRKLSVIDAHAASA